jgi:hypothetical protein
MNPNIRSVKVNPFLWLVNPAIVEEQAQELSSEVGMLPSPTLGRLISSIAGRGPCPSIFLPELCLVG